METVLSVVAETLDYDNDSSVDKMEGISLKPRKCRKAIINRVSI